MSYTNPSHHVYDAHGLAFLGGYRSPGTCPCMLFVAHLRHAYIHIVSVGFSVILLEVLVLAQDHMVSSNLQTQPH
jgi:hypothetical protein